MSGWRSGRVSFFRASLQSFFLGLRDIFSYLEMLFKVSHGLDNLLEFHERVSVIMKPSSVSSVPISSVRRQYGVVISSRWRRSEGLANNAFDYRTKYSPVSTFSSATAIFVPEWYIMVVQSFNDSMKVKCMEFPSLSYVALVQISPM